MTVFLNKYKRGIGVLVVFVLLAASCFINISDDIFAIENSDEKNRPPDSSGGKTGSADGKDEVIYANMDSAGNVKELFVVNVLDIDNSGTSIDYGEYTKVVNLTDTTAVEQVDDKITVNTSPGKFYYEGYSENNEIPWIVDIDYYLDGVKADPSDLAGGSGKLKIKISVNENPDADSLFYEKYMLQISVPMDMDVANNINSGGASEVLSGNTKLVNYMILPESEGDFTLTADVVSFEMESMQISGIPFSMDYDLSELDNMMGEFDTLVDAADQLDSGYNDLNSGIRDMGSGLVTTKDGSSKINSGLKKINKGTSKLSSASDNVNSGIKTMSKSLNNSLNVDDISTMLGGLEGMASGLSQISTGMTSMLDGLSVYRNDIPDVPKSALGQLAQSGEDYADEIVDYITSTGAFLYAYDKYASQAAKISTSVGAISTSLTYITGEMKDLEDIGKLQTGLSSLSSQYKKFNKHLQSYLGGVDVLAEQYGKMNSGISSISNGMGQLVSGSNDYAGGIGMFASSVSDIPGQIQEQVDGIMGTGEDFKAKSFISSKNKNVNSVQFVMTTDKIKVEKNAKEEADESESSESMLDKLWGLFKKN